MPFLAIAQEKTGKILRKHCIHALFTKLAEYRENSLIYVFPHEKRNVHVKSGFPAYGREA